MRFYKGHSRALCLCLKIVISNAVCREQVAILKVKADCTNWFLVVLRSFYAFQVLFRLLRKLVSGKVQQHKQQQSNAVKCMKNGTCHFVHRISERKFIRLSGSRKLSFQSSI